MTVGAALTGCATAPVQTAAGYVGEGAHATYGAASTGAHAVYATGGQVYMGVGQAAKKPLHDLNMMQDPIPVVLLRDESKPYDLTGLNSCERILNQVAELDLALGPDLDSPKDNGRSRVNRGADAAAVAALDAATDAAEHFLPMRSVIKRVSGATRYENHVKHAVLAGTVRRAFLKAIGMAHNCGWPASPLIFNATDVAMVSSAWTAPGDPAGLQRLAIATPAPLAVPSVSPTPSAVRVASATPPPAPLTRRRGRMLAPKAAVETVATNTAPPSTTSAQVVATQVVATQVVAAPAASNPAALTQPAPRQTLASTPAAAPVFMQRAVKVSASDTAESPADPAASRYAAPLASAASFTSSGPAAPWAATPQH